MPWCEHGTRTMCPTIPFTHTGRTSGKRKQPARQTSARSRDGVDSCGADGIGALPYFPEFVGCVLDVEPVHVHAAATSAAAGIHAAAENFDAVLQHEPI